MRTMRITVVLSLGTVCAAAVHEHPGGKTLEHAKYIHVVSEADSPVQQVYVKAEDGLYIAAAVRKPKGSGRFPALVYFHGAPGGRGMEQLSGWSRGDHGGPVWERFLAEGYVVVVADYRGGPRGSWVRPAREGEVSMADDGVSVVEYVRGLSFVDPSRITLYGVSLGGNVVLHTISRTKVHSAILGAPAPMGFLGYEIRPGDNRPWAERMKDVKPSPEIAQKNIGPIGCAVLILVGTKDGLLPVDRQLYDLLSAAGKQVRMDIYENGYHDFVVGPQGHKGRDEPLLDATLDALELSLRFVRNPSGVTAER